MDPIDFEEYAKGHQYMSVVCSESENVMMIIMMVMIMMR